MMSGSVVFTYKRRRFSNKPQIIDELQSDPSAKPPIGDECKIEVSLSETKFQIEPQNMAELQSDRPIGDCLRETKQPQIESEKIEDSFANSQIEPQKIDEMQSDLMDVKDGKDATNGALINPNSTEQENTIIVPIEETRLDCNKYRFKYKSRSKSKSKSPEKNRTEIDLTKPAQEIQPETVNETKIFTEKEREIEIEIKILPEKESEMEIEMEKFPEKERETEIEMRSFPEKEKETEIEMEIFPEKEREAEIEMEKFPEKERESEIEMEKFPEKEREAEIEMEIFPEKEREAEFEMEKFPEVEMEKFPEKGTETETEMEKFPEKERVTELEWLNSLERDLNERKKESEGSNVKFHKSSDLHSLKPNFDQEISSSSASQTKSKSQFCTTLFGVSIQTINAQNLKGKSVNLPTITHDFFPGPKTDQSRASTSARPKFQENLNLNNNNNYYYYNNTNNNYYYYGVNNNNFADWTEAELDSLWIGVRRYGTNNWYGMLNDPIFCFNKYKSCDDLAKRWDIEQRKLFSVPIPVSGTGPYRYGTDLSLGDMNYNHNEYMGYNNNYNYSYNDNISSGYLHNNSRDYFANEMFYASYNNCRRAKYQTRRAPRPSVNKNNVNTNNSININNNNGNNNNELPHWLREMIELPAGGVKRKLSGDELNRNELFDLNEKKAVPNLVQKSVPVRNLVVIDSDDDDVAGSDETISE